MLAFENNSSMWSRSTIQPDANYLFPHVQDFFGLNQAGTTETDPNQSILYEIKSGSLTPEEKESLFLHNSLFKRTHTAEIEGRSISFSMFQDISILSPKIFYTPLTQVGIFTFGLHLDDDSAFLHNLLDTNYHLRIIAAGQVQDIVSPRNTHEKAQDQEDKISEELRSFTRNDSDQGDFKWTIKTLFDYFLSEIKTRIEVLSPARLQAFTYLALADDLEDDDLEIALFRLRRVYSHNYDPAPGFLVQKREVAQVFDKVLYGATVEGAVVMVRPDEKPFLRNYSQTVTRRTIWTYLLAFHQRYALISAASNTKQLFGSGANPTTTEISEMVDRISKIQLKCLFNEISHYSQQNDFYYLCYNNLRVQEIFQELNQEVTEINNILTEKWRDEEAKHRETEAGRNARNRRKLEILIAVLIIPQIWFAAMSTNMDRWVSFLNKHHLMVNILNVAVWVGIIGVVLWVFGGRRKD